MENWVGDILVSGKNGIINPAVEADAGRKFGTNRRGRVLWRNGNCIRRQTEDANQWL